MNKQMKILGSLLFSSALVFAAACGDDGINDGNGGNGGNGTGGDGTGATGAGTNDGGNGGEGGIGGDPFVIPPKPGLGDQIDRMGRPAINTALKGAFLIFDANGDIAPSNDASRFALQDGYNEDDVPADWVDNSRNIFALNLAVIDSVEAFAGGTSPTNAQACGTTPGCPIKDGSNPPDGDETDPTCYGTFATVAGNDLLFVNTAGEDCSAADPTAGLTDPLTGYLAVEFAALGLANTGCGGRRPIDDVIDVTYGVLATGSPVGFSDNIDEEPGTHPEIFPFLDTP
jgi:hypothetical protein